MIVKMWNNNEWFDKSRKFVFISAWLLLGAWDKKRDTIGGGWTWTRRGGCWTSGGEWNSCWLQWPDAEEPLTWSLMCWYIFCLIMFFVKLCRLDKIWCEQRPLAVEDCQKEAMTENREDVTREDEDRWCQKQVQVLNVIFRPVGKIILSLSRRQSTSRSAGGGGLQ